MIFKLNSVRNVLLQVYLSHPVHDPRDEAVEVDVPQFVEPPLLLLLVGNLDIRSVHRELAARIVGLLVGQARQVRSVPRQSEEERKLFVGHFGEQECLLEVIADLLCDLPALQDRSQVLGPEYRLELPLPLLPVVGDQHQPEDAKEDDHGGEGEEEREEMRLVLHLGLQGAELHVEVLVLRTKSKGSLEYANFSPFPAIKLFKRESPAINILIV